jgi:hypothetical protein
MQIVIDLKVNKTERYDTTAIATAKLEITVPDGADRKTVQAHIDDVVTDAQNRVGEQLIVLEQLAREKKLAEERAQLEADRAAQEPVDAPFV